MDIRACTDYLGIDILTRMLAKEELSVGHNGIGWVSSDFKSRFFESEIITPWRPGTWHKLPRSMKDTEIEKEFNIQHSSLGEVLGFLRNPPEGSKDGYVNIFYFPVCVVNVHWSAVCGGWHVNAWPRDDGEWSEDYRIFSPATDTHSSGTVSSDTLTLVERDQLIRWLRLHCSSFTQHAEKGHVSVEVRLPEIIKL